MPNQSQTNSVLVEEAAIVRSLPSLRENEVGFKAVVAKGQTKVVVDWSTLMFGSLVSSEASGFLSVKEAIVDTWPL